MIDATRYQLAARCACGRVLLKLMGAPIVTVVCYCDDCQEGARRIESMPQALPVKDADGGTPYLVYRKDRLEFAAGREYLLAHKLRPASTTHRVVASCCHSPMYLGFDRPPSVTAIYNRYGYLREMRRILERWANDLTAEPPPHESTDSFMAA